MERSVENKKIWKSFVGIAFVSNCEQGTLYMKWRIDSSEYDEIK